MNRKRPKEFGDSVLIQVHTYNPDMIAGFTERNSDEKPSNFYRHMTGKVLDKFGGEPTRGKVSYCVNVGKGNGLRGAYLGYPDSPKGDGCCVWVDSKYLTFVTLRDLHADKETKEITRLMESM